MKYFLLIFLFMTIVPVSTSAELAGNYNITLSESCLDSRDADENTECQTDYISEKEGGKNNGLSGIILIFNFKKNILSPIHIEIFRPPQKSLLP